MATQLEQQIETDLVARAAALGGEALKIQAAGRRGFPDRLVLLPVPPEHREIVARYVRFVELKRPGERPGALQQHWLRRLTSLGLFATWASSKEAVAKMFN